MRVHTHAGDVLGWGHWGSGSIAVRLLERGLRTTPPDASWWCDRIASSLAVRRATGLWNGAQDPRGFRAVHGEGDGLSGLVIDVYAGLAVIQTHTLGMLLGGIHGRLGGIQADHMRASPFQRS